MTVESDNGAGVGWTPTQKRKHDQSRRSSVSPIDEDKSFMIRLPSLVIPNTINHTTSEGNVDGFID